MRERRSLLKMPFWARRIIAGLLIATLSIYALAKLEMISIPWIASFNPVVVVVVSAFVAVAIMPSFDEFPRRRTDR